MYMSFVRLLEVNGTFLQSLKKAMDSLPIFAPSHNFESI